MAVNKPCISSTITNTVEFAQFIIVQFVISLLFRRSWQNSYLLCVFLFVKFINLLNSSPLSITEKCFVQLIRHLQFHF